MPLAVFTRHGGYRRGPTLRPASFAQRRQPRVEAPAARRCAAARAGPRGPCTRWRRSTTSPYGRSRPNTAGRTGQVPDELLAASRDECPLDARGPPCSLTIPAVSSGPRIDTQADTQSDTLRSGRPCDSWTPLEAKVREFLSKTHRWTPSDAGGSPETELLIRVSLVRSQRGPPIESTTYRGQIALSPRRKSGLTP